MRRNLIFSVKKLPSNDLSPILSSNYLNTKKEKSNTKKTNKDCLNQSLLKQKRIRSNNKKEIVKISKPSKNEKTKKSENSNKKEPVSKNNLINLKENNSKNPMNRDSSLIDLCDTTIDEIPKKWENLKNKDKDNLVKSNTSKKRGRPKKVEKSSAKKNENKNDKQSNIKQIFTLTDKQIKKDTYNDNQSKQIIYTQKLYTEKDTRLQEQQKDPEIKVNSSVRSLKKELNDISIKFEYDNKKNEYLNLSKITKKKVNQQEEVNKEKSLFNFNTFSENSFDSSSAKDKVIKTLKIIKTENIEGSTDSENENNSPPGNFDYDVPLKIEQFKLNESNSLYAVIKWKPRYDGSIPRKSIFPIVEILANCPSLLNKYLMEKLTKRNCN